MPGFELWGTAERKEVNDVLETGMLMRFVLMNLEKELINTKNWNTKTYEILVSNVLN